MSPRPALPAVFLALPLAHRGLHDRAAGVIENSRVAFEAAIRGGYGIELDLQLSADGEAMVFHDDDLDRLTEAEGPVGLRSATELGEIRLGEGDETIPTLTEVLSLVAGRVPLLVEIKDQSRAMASVDGRLERRAAALLSAYDGPAALMSFNPHSVTECRGAAPEIPRGRTTCAFAEGPWGRLPAARRAALARLDDLDALGCSFISHQHDDLRSDAVAKVKASGRPVLAWTIRSREEEEAARAVADNITFEGYAA
ncbi:phosphodiesterase [Pikeienuella piscinae]|uniref:Phosphodiesterase n=1 Tax=Pikeienuella piscinae TaxID=2748098 RepID=A0A7L5C370_9RHOB|nr:glycerophosphodiester phosphodiesterase family protein [Pikeienuella piscinae]QIE56956.1 phosphodiesterase [Pikeienuella piscinae]